MSLLKHSRLFGDQMNPRLNPHAGVLGPSQGGSWLGKHLAETDRCLHTVDQRLLVCVAIE